jgi:hypothetical protein
MGLAYPQDLDSPVYFPVIQQAGFKIGHLNWDNAEPIGR